MQAYSAQPMCLTELHQSCIAATDTFFVLHAHEPTAFGRHQ